MPMTPQQGQRPNDPEEQHAFRDLHARHDLRQIGAREEFARWREAHPNFTSRELLDHWQRIRVAWGLSPPEKTRQREPR